MNPTISIIVPVYNAELYIQECIDSILLQSYSQFELILVDDGSLDRSLKICNQKALGDSRIRVIHQENAGVTRARARGVEAARGEWITFVDADDWLPMDALESLMESAKEADIVIGNLFLNQHYLEVSLHEYRDICIKGSPIHCGPVAKLFRRSLFDSNTFDLPRDIIRGEDQIMNVRLAFATKRAPKIINKQVYCYRRNEEGVMVSSVHTIEHAELFHKYLLLSIPPHEIDDYRKSIIFNKFISLRNVINDKPSDSSWRHSVFYSQLNQEIKAINYIPSLKEKMWLWVRGSLSLRIVQYLYGRI